MPTARLPQMRGTWSKWCEREMVRQLPAEIERDEVCREQEHA
jgi:hypothetical protein